MNHRYAFVIVALIGCQPNSDTHTKTVQIFGDSLKVEYEYHGDTVIQNRIDLKGITDDGFDNSFTVTSIWSSRNPTYLDCRNRLKLREGNLYFTFCVDDVIKKVDNDIVHYNGEGFEEELRKLRSELVKINQGTIDSLSTYTDYLTFDLLRSVDFSISTKDGRVRIKTVRIEEYETEFSGGRNYYIIGEKMDTVARFDVNEWIR